MFSAESLGLKFFWFPAEELYRTSSPALKEFRDYEFGIELNLSLGLVLVKIYLRGF